MVVNSNTKPETVVTFDEVEVLKFEILQKKDGRKGYGVIITKTGKRRSRTSWRQNRRVGRLITV